MAFWWFVMFLLISDVTIFCGITMMFTQSCLLFTIIMQTTRKGIVCQHFLISLDQTGSVFASFNLLLLTVVNTCRELVLSLFLSCKMFIQCKLSEIVTFCSSPWSLSAMQASEDHDTDWMFHHSLNQFYFYDTKHLEQVPKYLILSLNKWKRCWNCLPKRFKFGLWFETNWFKTFASSSLVPCGIVG